MPHYYFDIDDGERLTSDDCGQDCDDPGVARKLAIGVLPNIARDMLPDGDRHDFVVNIRDEMGRQIFRATLSLSAEWLGEQGHP